MTKLRIGFFKRGWPLGAFLGLTHVASAQAAYGMSVSLLGVEEIAGANAASHSIVMKVKLDGGTPNSYTGDQANGTSDEYGWRLYTTRSGGTVQAHYGGSSATEGSTGQAVYQNQVLAYTYPVNTTLSGPFKAVLTACRVYRSWNTDVNNARHTTTTISFQEVTYDSFRLRGFPLQIASVDSRKAYAVPNAQGLYPGMDANAEARNVGFAGWAYRGGLFVGNAFGVNGDQSGVARIQAQAAAPGSLPTCRYTLTLLHIGAPSFFKSASNQWDAPFTVTALLPTLGSGPTVPLSSLTWANSLDPATCTGAGSVNLSTAPAKEYVNFDLGAGGFPARVLLMGPEGGSTPLWRYFGGPAYQPPSPTPPNAPAYPFSECAPHLWGADVPGTSYLEFTGTARSGPDRYYNTGYINDALWAGV